MNIANEIERKHQNKGEDSVKRAQDTTDELATLLRDLDDHVKIKNYIFLAFHLCAE